MKQPDFTAAIQATLSGDWETAIIQNQLILKVNPKDLEALNRLAFAYTALGKIKEAKTAYQKVLKIDKLNAIANKNIKRLGESATRRVKNTTYRIDNAMFLESAGKTKVISLINTAPMRTLTTLQIGQPCQLVIKRLKIFVLDDVKQYIGMLPDNISRRLIKFIKGGNEYSAHIKSIEDSKVGIFVKEIKRAARFKNQTSFVVSETPKNMLTMSKKKFQFDESSESETSEE